MKFNIISNIANGVGLQRDYEMVRQLLLERGHQAVGVQFNGARKPEHADCNIFLETLVINFFECAKEQWFVPNPEWCFEPWLPALARADVKYVLCKTEDAMDIMAARGVPKEKLRYIGFAARDMYDPAIPRKRAFLHVAGKSQTKNTPAVIAAWKSYVIAAPLTIVSSSYTSVPMGIDLVQRVSDVQLSYLMNSHQFHIMPSAYEGYGHALHEGMSCGAIVLTTDKPPMNRIGAHLHIPSTIRTMHHIAPLWQVNGADVFAAVSAALAMSRENINAASAGARIRFVYDNADFIKRFTELI